MTDNLFVDPLPNQDMTVSTDKADYAPGETVKITASGFAKGSTITFAIADDPSDFGDDGDRDFYTLSPNPITDGGVGDLDGNANGEVVTTWFVPTDNNGTGSGIPDALNGTLILRATDSNGQMATTMFMDAVQTDYRGWENIVSAGVEWANGGINQGQGLYLEGDYVPHAVYFKGLTVGTTYTFEISFNAYQATSNAGGYVAIGTYNQSVQPTLLFPASSGGPLVDTTPMTGTGTSGFFYTSDFNNNSMNDADVTSVGNVFIDSGTISSSDVEERALVTFTATNSDATIYYGLRLALPGEVAPGTQGADGFTGLSLQSSVKNGPTGPAIGGGGNVQLAPGAVTQGSISGYKWNDADGSTTLNGTESKLPGWEIQLYKDDGDGIFEPVTASSGTTADTLVGTRTTDASGNYMFSGATGTSVIRGTYFIREVLQLGWTATTPTTPTSPDNGLGYYTATINETTPIITTFNFGNRQLNPSIEVIKTAGDATDGATLTTLAGNVTYSYKVSNTGDVVLSNVTVKDDNGTPGNPSDDFIVGTIASLAVGTSQTLTSTRSITTDTTNIATATGTTPINGTVSDTDNAVVDVIARTGDLKITKTDCLTKVVPGQCVTYTIVVSNCGPDTATHALVEDLFPSNLTDVKWTSKAAKGATDNKARGTDNIEDYVTLPAGSSITYKVTGTVVGGPGSHKVSDCHRTLTNTATVTAPSDFTDTNLENNTATDIDTIMAAPGVRNAHFWQNTKWQKSWDGVQGNEPSQKTRPNFPDSDLLLSPYTNSTRPGKVLDPVTRRYGVGLLIGDYNHNGKTDKKENTLFYTRAQALQIVDSSMHPNNRDTRYILGRDLVTSWLNYLAGNSIDTPNSNDQDARDYINEGIQWLQALTPDQNRDGKGDGYLQGLTGNETSNSRTPRILARSSYWRSGISSGSNLPNSYKSNTDVLYPIDAGITIHTHLDNYNNNIF